LFGKETQDSRRLNHEIFNQLAFNIYAKKHKYLHNKAFNNNIQISPEIIFYVQAILFQKVTESSPKLAFPGQIL
jgi:hypothetical protein